MMGYKFLLMLVGVTAVAASPLRVRRQTITDPNIEALEWGPWSACDQTCDHGNTTRSLTCRLKSTGQTYKCASTYASCNMFPCTDKYKWKTWGTCTAACGGGVRRRAASLTTDIQEILCHTQPCQIGLGCGKADVLFVLDSSGSVGDSDWYTVKQFAIDVLINLKDAIDAGDTRVAAISFSTDISVSFHLSEHTTFADVEAALWKLKYLAGATNTAEALYTLRTKMMTAANGDRPGIKNIVVVVTDGASNILKENTIKEAEALKALGHEVFAIGVTDRINKVELQHIASKPIKGHMFELADFKGLAKITKLIAAGACRAPIDGKWGEWIDWTVCSAQCEQTRNRQCDKPKPENDGKNCVGDTAETRPCTTGQCPATTTSTTTTTTIATIPTQAHVPEPDCSTCHYVNGIGYFADPKDCSKYYQCQEHNGGYIKHHMNCPNGLFWSVRKVVCDWPTYVKCGIRPIVTRPPPASTTTEAPVDKCTANGMTYEAHPTDKTKYIWTWAPGSSAVMTCAQGTVFVPDQCQCDHDTTGLQVTKCEDGLLLYYPFDVDWEDHSCLLKAKSSIIGEMILKAGKRDKCAYFDGNSRIEVAAMMNAFNGVELEHFSIMFWMKKTGSDNVVDGLVNNGDCVYDASFSVDTAADDTISAGIHTSESTTLEAYTDVQIKKNEWHHVAMIYSGQSVDLYMDGKKTAASVTRTGFILNRYCPMSIAYQGKDEHTGFFTGYIDELRVYAKTVTETEVTQLMNL